MRKLQTIYFVFNWLPSKYASAHTYWTVCALVYFVDTRQLMVCIFGHHAIQGGLVPFAISEFL